MHVVSSMRCEYNHCKIDDFRDFNLKLAGTNAFDKDNIVTGDIKYSDCISE